jgi:NhaA family Na+:H+ antiporter
MSIAEPVPIDRVLAPLREFVHSNVASGVLLLAAAAAALLWVNSPLGASYGELWEAPLTIGVGDLAVTLSLHHWINDGLMAIFFLVVGLEIKRELLVGELASRRRAVLPVAAAAGGALLPALIFLLVVGPSNPGARGWGVPMATDIAFALGALALLGRRVPLGLRVFVAALAIADDLLAVLVIALFYTAEVSIPAVVATVAIVIALVAANRLGVRRPMVYGALGIVLWLAVLESGVHATVAGVLLAMTIPARQRVSNDDFADKARALVDDFADASAKAPQERYSKLWELESLTEKAQAPMLRLEHALTPFVSFLVVPLFALANAGVSLAGDPGRLLADPLVPGIVLGLVLGKQLGITAAAWLVVRWGFAALPHGVRWGHIYGAAWVCAIGFTMSLFIADLAYGPSEALEMSKIGILLASVIAAVGGVAILVWQSRRRPHAR